MINSSSFLERVMGIEPTQPAWKAGVLPLYYTRNDDAIIPQSFVKFKPLKGLNILRNISEF